jgi:flavodoxin
VVFHSHEGNTRLLAQNIADEIGADLEELLPQKAVTTGPMKFFWGGSQVMMGRRPPIGTLRNRPDDYDLIFIGTPVWAWTHTPPVSTFLRDHRPEGKKIALFASCEGGPGKALDRMMETLEGNDLLGREWFFAPLKKDREATLRRARDWAREVLAKA